MNPFHAVEIVFRLFSLQTVEGFPTQKISLQKLQYYYRFHRTLKNSGSNYRSLQLSSSTPEIETVEDRCSCHDNHPSYRWNVSVLMDDPKVFVVENFLSEDECMKYIERAKYRRDDTTRDVGMTRSNAPLVSLDTSRLWPLPLFCSFAGVPSSVRYIQETQAPFELVWKDILLVAIPPILFATCITTLLAFLMLQLMRQMANTYSRTSDAVSFNAPEDCEFIRPLVQRSSLITNNHPWTGWEAPVVTRYSKGERFTSHNDASFTKGSEWSALGGQRIVTVITYLTTCNNGGGTKFDHLGFTVQPKQGMALVFFPSDSHTLVADQRTVHQSLPAIDEKWIVQLFGRINRVPPPLGIPDSFGDHPIEEMENEL